MADETNEKPDDAGSENPMAPAGAPRPPVAGTTLDEGTLARVVLYGDLTPLTSRERFNYYLELCRAIDVNPAIRPFDFIETDDPNDKDKKRIILYPNARCTDALRANHGISIEKPEIEEKHGCFVVTVKATYKGRTDFATGVVPLQKQGGKWVDTGQKYRDGNPKRRFEPDGSYIDLSPLEKANAMMKAETKAARRVTLRLCGLAGMPDPGDLEDGVLGNVRQIDAESFLQGREAPALASPATTSGGEPSAVAPATTKANGNGGPSISIAVKKFVAARDDLAAAIETKTAGTKLDAEARKKLGEDWALKTVGDELAAAIREAMAKSETGYVDAEIYRVAAAMNGEAMRIRNGGVQSTPAAPEPKQKTLV